MLMDIKFLEQFCQSKGLEIAQTLIAEYDSAEFETDGKNIEREIYEVATSYSRIFFFEAKTCLSDSLRNEVKTHLTSRFDGNSIQKLKDIDLLTHWIKSEVIGVLQVKDTYLL